MARFKQMVNDKIILMLWGPPMSGKTVLASQFPNPTFVDLDGQIGSVRSLTAEADIDIDFPVIQVDESAIEDEDFVKLCGKRFTTQDAWVKTKKLVSVLANKLTKNETLVLDNISRASEYLINHIKKVNNREALQIQDWGLYVNEMTELIDYVHSKHTKCTSIIIGHEGLMKDEMSGRVLRGLSIPTRVKERIPSKCSDYLYMTTEVTGSKRMRQVKRVLQSVPDPSNPTGSRCLIPNVEDQTYAKLRPYFEKYLGRELGEPTWTPKSADHK